MEYPELGMEAVWKVEVEDFPAFVVIDDNGRTSSPRPPRRPCRQASAVKRVPQMEPSGRTRSPASSPRLPSLQPAGARVLGCRRRPDHDARPRHDDPVGSGEHGVEHQRPDLGQVLGQPVEP